MRPHFAAFEREKSVAPADAFRAPRCLATRCDAAAEQYAIVLEDLRFGGWQLCDKFRAVDEAHGRCVAEALARFHAVSVALRDQRPALFDELACMENGFLRHVEEKTDETRAFFGVAWKRAMEALGAEDEQLRRKFWAATEDFVPIVQRCLRYAPAEARRVIGHGDFWNNNMMFEYDEVSGGGSDSDSDN